MKEIDHPIFNQSIQIIRAQLGSTGLDPIQQQVLERLIHTTGDFSIQSSLRFSPKACQSGINALKKGAIILTDTAMAREAVLPMASRTLATTVKCILDWSPPKVDKGITRTGIGMIEAWKELSRQYEPSSSPIVLIGSSPTALEALLDLLYKGFQSPSLIIGMPVGFVGVLKSKNRLSNYNCSQIRLDGNRGGAAPAASVVNALLRASFINN